jgi:hypothetical protein
VKVTHGRHCVCSACKAQDWTEPQLASCGMHGNDCPYPAGDGPLFAPGDEFRLQFHPDWENRFRRLCP